MHNIIAAASAGNAMQWVKDAAASVQSIFSNFGSLGNIILALIVFLVLKRVAGLIKGLLVKALDKTSLDEKLGAKLGYKSNVSGMLANIVHLVFLIFVAVIALDVANLDTASEPLNKMLNGLLGFIPKIIGAGILLYILLFIANIVKQLLANVLSVAKIDERVGSTTGTPIANSLVTAAYGFLVLLFIPAVLDVLEIEAISRPIKGIVDSVTSAVPNVLLAGVILAIGVLIGQIASRVITNLLKGTGVDNAPQKIGFSLPTEGKGAISSIVGTVVLVSIAVTVFAAALDALKISIFSGLSTSLVGGYYNILLAVIILAAGIVGSKFAFNALADKHLLVAKIARTLILVVSSVVALDRAGIASDLTSLPYQVAIYAIGVAAGIGGAIAIGLGAREYVANYLNKRG